MKTKITKRYVIFVGEAMLCENINSVLTPHTFTSKEAATSVADFISKDLSREAKPQEPVTVKEVVLMIR